MNKTTELITELNGIKTILAKQSDLVENKKKLIESLEHEEVGVRDRFIGEITDFMETERAKQELHLEPYKEAIGSVYTEVVELREKMVEQGREDAARKGMPLKQKVSRKEETIASTSSFMSILDVLSHVRLGSFTLFPSRIKEWIVYVVVTYLIAVLGHLIYHKFGVSLLYIFFYFIPFIRLYHLVQEAFIIRAKKQLNSLIDRKEITVSEAENTVPINNKLKKKEEALLAQLEENQILLGEKEAESEAVVSEKAQPLFDSLESDVDRIMKQHHIETMKKVTLLEEELRKISEQINAIPRPSVDYMKSEIINKLLGYIQNEQAASLGEAITLYDLHEEGRIRIEQEERRLLLDGRHFESEVDYETDMNEQEWDSYDDEENDELDWGWNVEETQTEAGLKQEMERIEFEIEDVTYSARPDHEKELLIAELYEKLEDVTDKWINA